MQVTVDRREKEIRRNTVYVVGGREHPFQAGVACPRKRCKHVIYLDIAPEITRRWSLTEHDDGRVSLSPSVHVTGLQVPLLDKTRAHMLERSATSARAGGERE